MRFTPFLVLVLAACDNGPPARAIPPYGIFPDATFGPSTPPPPADAPPQPPDAPVGDAGVIVVHLDAL